MARKKHTPEQIVAILRQIEVAIANNKPTRKPAAKHMRSDNGPEFVAEKLRKWLSAAGAKTLYIEPGSPWENGYCESFNES